MRKWLAVALCLALLGVPVSAAGAGGSQTLRAAYTVSGEVTGDASGYQVEVADLDGDRVGDLVIGAWQNDSGGTASGAVYIEYGPIRKSFNLKDADVKLFTPRAGEYVGEGPLGVADLDGDRADDIVIGAPGSFYAAQPGSPGKVGEAFLLYGGKRLRGDLQLPKVADARFTGLHITEWLGFGSSGVGDLDDDGFDDMLIGAPATAGFSGAAYLFYGARERLDADVPVTSADAIIIGGRPAEMFGYEATGGDVDGDGDDDLFVASRPLAGGPASISMFPGGARMTGVVPAAAAHSYIPFATVDYFTGPALSSGADLTGDGVDDLLVGLGVSFNPGARPATYIIGGSKEAFTRGPLLGPHAVSLGGAGDAVAIGDINGDGKPDLVTGAPNTTDGGTVYVFFGPVDEGQLNLDDANATFTGESGSGSGAALATGQIGGGRGDDLLIGAPSDAGRTYVVLGRR